MKSHTTLRLALVLALAFGAAACGGSEEAMPPAGSDEAARPAGGTAEVTTAVADLQPLGGSGVSGTVTFTKGPAGVQIQARVTGLTPGRHGFHVHENGDCSAPDGSSAGGHFNPTGVPHAGPDAAQAHVGDMGNLVADAQGTAVLTMRSPRMTIGHGQTDILGKAVIVHGGADDLSSQPSGAAGPRVACGVIRPGSAAGR